MSETNGGIAPGGESGEGGTLLGRPTAQYLDGAADSLAAAKAEILRRLAPGPGERVLDVGCGNGTDVLEIARRVGPDGAAVGVDVNADAIVGAVRRARAAGVDASFQVASVYALPFPAARFDAVRAERMVQHLDDPLGAIAELLRVTRPGGRVLVADPDHGMWAPDLSDREAVQRVLTWWFSNVRNPWTGRRLHGLLGAAGLRDVRATVLPVVLGSVAAADGLTGLMGALRRAGEQGVIRADLARDLLSEAALRDTQGGFQMYGAVVLAEGRRPE